MDNIETILSSVTQSPEKAQTPPATAEWKPPGWWSLPGLNGTREAVTRAIQCSQIPEYWKTAITSQISAVEPKFNMVEVHGHFIIQNGKSDLMITITPSVGLV